MKFLTPILKEGCLILIIILFSHCNSKENASLKRNYSLNGDWFFIDKELGYSEVYINDSTFSFFIESTRSLYTMNYKRAEDSLILKNQTTRIVGFINADTIVLSHFNTKPDSLFKIKEKFTLGMVNNENDYINYLKSFIYRREKFLHDREITDEQLKTIQDSLIEEIVPKRL